MADFRVNGNMLSWPDVVARAAGKPVAQLCGISYGDKRERVVAYGQGRHYAPIGRTAGKYSTDPLKLTFYKGGSLLFMNMIAELARDRISYGNVEFEFSVQYIQNGSGAPIHVQFKRTCIVGIAGTDDESSDPSKDELELQTLQIVRNGKTLFDSEQGAP
jgi:hypothetical protein